MKLKMIDSECECEREAIRRDQPAIICGCHERTVNFLHIQCAVIQYLHTTIAQRASFTFFLHSQILLSFIPFCCFFLIRLADSRSTMPSAMVDTKERENNEEREKLITFLFIIHRNGKKITGWKWSFSSFFSFSLLLLQINLFDHTNCVMITKHYHRRMRNAFSLEW